MGSIPFVSLADGERVASAISQCKSFDCGAISGTFASTGWFDEVTGWVAEHLHPHGLSLTDEWVQYNTGPFFSLIRYETSGPDVWFKAVGEPNLREFTITMKLAELCPSYLPELLATHHGWHGWLALDANGQHLDETWDIQFWKIAVRSLAEMQLQTIGESNVLIAAGCSDLRLKHLPDLIEPFVTVVAQLMPMQTVSHPRILSSKDLEMIEDKLKLACERLESLGLPDALGQTDLNAGNVLVNSDRAIFIDWVEGTVGHPFITCEYLLALLGRLRPDLEIWSTAIRETYAGPWKQFCSAKELERTFRLTPLVAVLAFAANCPGWKDDIHEIEQGTAKLLRALARRMYAEAQKIGRTDC